MKLYIFPFWIIAAVAAVLTVGGAVVCKQKAEKLATGETVMVSVCDRQK